MANTMKALQTVTVGAGGVASVTFSSIPATYTDLIIKTSVRSVGTGGSGFDDYLNIRFNGDSGTNYGERYLQGYAGAAQTGGNSSRNKILAGFGNGSSSTSNTFSNNEIYISNYAGSTFKSLSIDGVLENNNVSDYVMRLIAPIWNNTAAITSINLFLDGANIAQYSTFTLYGVFNADVSSAPATPTIGTATAGNASASITFTGVANAASYTMTSSPGSLTGTGTTSPITVSGLSNGTAYTFTCRANNPFGSSGASAASNSVTPVAPVAPSSIEVLVVAGGGGAANAGAGAGGLSYNATKSVTASTAYTVTIGGGGTGVPVNQNGATNGSNSVFDNITSNGGGASRDGGTPGVAGGSGAGEYNSSGTGASNQGNTGGATGYGFRGGNSIANQGGGGGGAGAIGGTGGPGGVGREYWNTSGASTFYAGGGGTYNYGSGGTTAGGNGGGGNGGGGSGTANTGGGAGSGVTGGNGGSGVVVIRYPDTFTLATSTTGSPTVNTTGGYRYYQFNGSGSITF